jgi:predicted DCC family thiol-disulfide oxidoreductase YuxK
MNQELGFEHLILFDGVCNLCNSSVQFVIRNDKKGIFRFASLQSDFGKLQLSKFGIDDKSMDSFVYIYCDKAYKESTAGLMVLKHLGRGWKFLYFLVVVPEFIRNRVYRLIARNRYRWFGKKDACMVPTPELKSRFF